MHWPTRLGGGVRIRVITNSYRSNDVKLVGAAWGSSRNFLASIGAEIWEHPGVEPGADTVSSQLQGWLKNLGAPRDPMPDERLQKGLRKMTTGLTGLHAKTMVVDGKVSYVMSYNFDPRSKELNMEVAERIDSPEFAQQLSDAIDYDLMRWNYRRVAANGTIDPSAIVERASCLRYALSLALYAQL